MKWMKWVHLAGLFIWLVTIPIAIYLEWIYSLAFIAACSIYANMVGHWSGWSAERPTRMKEPDTE